MKKSELINYKFICNMMKDLSDFLENKIQESKEKNICEEFEIFTKILVRFDVNLRTLQLILPHITNIIEYNLPLSLILRSINSDILSTYYLNSFILPIDSDLCGFKNELKVFDKDFVGFLKEFGEEELNLMKENCPQWENYIKILEAKVKEHYDNYSEFYLENKGKKKIVSNSEIRKTTPTIFFINTNSLNESSKFISEKYKYNRIKEIGQSLYCGHAFLSFKYYSQFQHISPEAIKLLYKNRDNLDYKFLLLTIQNIIFSTNLILKNILDNGFANELEPCFKRIDKLITKEFN